MDLRMDNEIHVEPGDKFTIRDAVEDDAGPQIETEYAVKNYIINPENRTNVETVGDIVPEVGDVYGLALVRAPKVKHEIPVIYPLEMDMIELAAQLDQKFEQEHECISSLEVVGNVSFPQSS